MLMEKSDALFGPGESLSVKLNPSFFVNPYRKMTSV